MTTQGRFLIAASFGFLAVAPALADDAVGESRMRRTLSALDSADAGGGPGRPALTSLRGIDSAGALFLKGAGDPASEAAQRSRVTSLAVTFNTTVTFDAPPDTPVAPARALALPLDAARPGGTNIYGFTRDPRATTTTPAGVRLADPKLVQAVKPDLDGSGKLARFTLAK